MFYKGLIFDLDNTLYSYSYCHKYALDKCIEYFVNITDKDYDTIKKIYSEITNKLKIELNNTASSHNKGIYIKHLIENLNISYSHFNIIYEIYWNSFYENMKPFDYVKEFFEWNKSKNIKIGIITDYETEYQIIKLQKLGLLEYVNCIVTSEEVGIEKPSYKIFYRILDKLKLQLEDVIIFGDNYEKDIIGSSNLGIKTFWVNSNDNFSYKEIYNKFTKYYEDLINLKHLSKYCGERFDLVQAGGGNISVKNDELMFIKSSGFSLSAVNETNGYVTIDNNKLISDILNNNTKDVTEYNYIGNKRGSIETYMHSILKKYTIHLHPIQINRILISSDAEKIIKIIYPSSLIIEYITPGIKVCDNIKELYNNQNVIFLLNHGIIITSDIYDEIYNILDEILIKFELYQNINFNKYKFTNKISKTINEKFNLNNISYLCEDALINNYLTNKNYLFKMNITFPDALIYCGISVLFGLENIDEYVKLYKDIPKIVVHNGSIYITSNSLTKCKEIEDVLKSNIMILDSELNKKYLTNDELYFLNNWESEKYRKLL